MNITFDLSKLVSVKFVEKIVCEYYKIEPEIKLFGKIIFPKSVKSFTGKRYSLPEFEQKIKEGEIKGIFVENNAIFQKPFLSLKFLNHDTHEEFYESDEEAKKDKYKILLSLEKQITFRK